MPTPRLAALDPVTLPSGLRLSEARTPLARLRGLAGLTSIEPDEALLLRRCRSVHTFGMRFPIDLVWLGADGAVVRVDEAVRPRRMKLCLAARAVVETAAHEGRRYQR